MPALRCLEITGLERIGAAELHELVLCVQHTFEIERVAAITCLEITDDNAAVYRRIDGQLHKVRARACRDKRRNTGRLGNADDVIACAAVDGLRQIGEGDDRIVAVTADKAVLSPFDINQVVARTPIQSIGSAGKIDEHIIAAQPGKTVIVAVVGGLDEIIAVVARQDRGHMRPHCNYG